MIKKLRNLLIVVAALATIAAVSSGAPASANISGNQWDVSTLYLQDMTPNSGYNAYVGDAYNYFNSLGMNINFVRAACVNGKACLRMYTLDQGVTGWDGHTDNPATGCLSPNAWCRAGAGGPGVGHDVALMYMNTHYLGTETNQQRIRVFRHELGHAFSMQHASGNTVMQATTIAVPPITFLSTEITELRNQFIGDPR